MPPGSLRYWREKDYDRGFIVRQGSYRLNPISQKGESPWITPPPRICGILPSLLILAVLAGCNQTPASGTLRESGPDNKPSLITEADREHDFGPVIASSGRRLEHSYRLSNSSPRDIRILDVINHKTCCGIVRVGKPILHPGDATDVEVTLLVGDRFGEVTHGTEVVTDLPAEPNFYFRTMARAVPPVRVEEESAFDRTILIGAKESRQAGFRVYASGTSSEPPLDLDRLELRSTIKVDWAGPKEPSPSDDDGLRVESRRFLATLDPAGPPGERRAEILLQEGKQVFSRQVVGWEIASRMAVSPKVIAMRPGQHDYRVVIRSRDQKPFRITRIECSESGIQGRAVNASAAVEQGIRVEGVPRSKARRGTVTVFTDHAIQEKVNLPFVMID